MERLRLDRVVEAQRKHRVQHESWGPFAEGKNNIFSDTTLSELAARHDKGDTLFFDNGDPSMVESLNSRKLD